MLQRKAFTIVELLVVMGVIAVIIGLVVAGIQQAQINSRTVERNNTTIGLKAALESYYNDYRIYPSLGVILIDTSNENILLCKPGTNCASDTTSLVAKVPYANGLSGIVGTPPAAACSAEAWSIYYSATPASRPQKYNLKYCSERGLSDDLGNN